MTPRCTPLHDTLQALAEDFAHAIVRAVREASLSELADAGLLPRVRERRRTMAPHASAPRGGVPTPVPGRDGRTRRSRTASATRAKPTQLELLIDRAETYPDAAIVDPTAILSGPRPAQDAPGRSIAPEKTSEAPPPPKALSVEPPKAAPPAMRPGEELLRAAGGGFVLRRRRAQDAAG